MRKLTTFLMFFLFSVAQVWAQNRTVTGKVTDEKGAAVGGATVKAGSTKGTSTKSDGTFTISVPSNVKTLTISGVGLNTQKVDIPSSGSVFIKMVTISEVAGEEIFISNGYKTETKRNSSASAAVIKADAFENKPTLSFDQNVTGKVAGLQVNTSSGLVGDNVVMRLRGTSSISSGSSPLIILDGVPLVSGDQGQLYNPSNALADLNPADIESMDVLKDAAATAIYGSRGAAGVLIITTKKGKAGSTNVTYDAYAGFVNPANKMTVLNADQYITTINKARNKAGLGDAAAYGDYDGDGVLDVVNTDWQKASYKQGFTQNHQVSVSSGTEKMNLYGSLSYNDYENYITANKQSRGAARVNITSKVTSNLEIGVKTQFSKTNSKGLGSGTGGALSGFPFGALTAAPNIPIYDPTSPADYYLGDGGNSITTGTPNPIAVQRLNFDNRSSSRFIGSTYGELKFLKKFKIKSQVAVDYQSAWTKQFWNPLVGDGSGFGGVAQTVYSEQSRWDWVNTLNYTNQFGKHSVNVLLGNEYTRAKGLWSYVGGIGQNDPTFFTLNNNNWGTIVAENSTPTGDINNGLASLFATFNYGYAGKYNASFTVRRDAFSGYGPDNKWGNFPAGAVSWRISDEKFMSKLRHISDLKLRVSYGVSGNSNIGDFGYAQIFSSSQYSDLSGLQLGNAGNSSLRWEKTAQFDAGFDLVLNKKINITFDYYDKKSIDLVFNNPIITQAGLGGSLTQNIGQIRNSGIELTVNAPIVTTKNFSWDVSFNIASNKSKVLQINDNNDQTTSGYGIAKKDYDLGAAYLIRWAGVNPENGLPTFFDANGVAKQYDFSQVASQRWTLVSDKSITSAISATDRVIDNKKTPYPKFFGGFSQNFKYRNFDLTVDLQYAFDFYLYNSTKVTLFNYNNLRNKTTDILNAWTTPGQQTDVTRLYYGDNFWTANANTRWLEKGDFVRIRNVQLGYSLPKSVLSKLKLTKLRIYIQGQNLYTITKYSGIDPEANAGGNTNIGFGVDQLRPYTPRIVTFGLSVGL